MDNTFIVFRLTLKNKLVFALLLLNIFAFNIPSIYQQEAENNDVTSVIVTEHSYPRIVSLPNGIITELGITELFY